MPRQVAARKDGKNVIFSIGPDVCLTPIGSSMVPIPYCSIVTLEDAFDVTTPVTNNNNCDFQLNSRAPGVTGHEPGVGRGVVVKGYCELGFADICSGSTASWGFAVARDADLAWINRPDRGPTEPRSGIVTKTIRHA